MRYIGNNCPACNKKFEPDDDIVVCPRCGTPEHKACWSASNECINAPLHDGGYIWQTENTSSPAPEQNHADTMPPANENSYGSSVPAGAQNGQMSADSVSCPNCGSINDTGEPSCIYCAARLYLVAPADRMPPPPDYSTDYRQPVSEIDGIPVIEVSTYIRQNASTYISKFTEMDNKQSKTRWNWAAFFFPTLWLFYRKMYKLGIIALAISLFSSIIVNAPTDALQYNKTMTDALVGMASGEISYDEYVSILEKTEIPSKIPEYISSLLNLSLSIYLGLYANSLYRKKVNEDILAIRAQNLPRDEYFKTLIMKGGGSVWTLLMGLVLNFCVQQLVVLLLSKLLL